MGFSDLFEFQWICQMMSRIEILTALVITLATVTVLSTGLASAEEPGNHAAFCAGLD